MSKYDHLFKILLIGDSGVGKSSILVRFSDDEFDEDRPCTIGVDFKSKTVQQNDKVVSLSLWDTAGQERFRSLPTTYYRGTQGIIFVYDVTSTASFESVNMWMEQASLYSTIDSVLLLVGNKVDREAERQVSRADGEAFARNHGMMFIECSAKTSAGIQQVFDELVAKILERPDLWPDDSAREGIAKIGAGGPGGDGQAAAPEPGQGWCC